MVHDIPDIDTFGSGNHRQIKVWSEPGFAACVDVIAKVLLPKKLAWHLLTHPENHKVFRSIKRVGKRRPLRGGPWEKSYEVEHFTAWSVLWFRGEFRTKLQVHENLHAGRLRFKLVESDVMQDFDGEWTITPFTQRALDKLYGEKQGFSFLGALSGFIPDRQNVCLVEFTQKVQPKAIPPALSGLARRIASKSMRDTLDDIDREAVKILAGKSCIDDLNIEHSSGQGGAGAQLSTSAAACTLSRPALPMELSSLFEQHVVPFWKGAAGEALPRSMQIGWADHRSENPNRSRVYDSPY